MRSWPDPPGCGKCIGDGAGSQRASLTKTSAVLRCARQGMLKTQPRLGSDGHGELVERNRHTPIRRLLNGQLVVSAPNALDERLPGDDDSGATVLLKPSHRSQARL